jgi:hypothetical protein
MQWTTVVKNFAEQWKALQDRKSGETPDVPKITKALPVIKWTQAFANFLHREIGVRSIALAYVIRDEVNIPGTAPTLLAGQPHSNEHGSIEAKLVARAQHTHALYRDDNANVYYRLEEATRTTAYAASIKPQRTKDGRDAFEALTDQYAGQDKWEAELKKQDNLLHTQEWKGQSNYTLECFVQQHRTAYVSMQSCADYVEYQLPTEHAQVGYLLDGIQCNDPGLQAAMASIKLDTTPTTGKQNNFELAATHLLPYDPVAKKHTSTLKRGAGDISDTTGVDISTFGVKEGIRKSGVHLRYHKNDEYELLNEDQKDELRAWRKTPEGQKQSKKGKPNGYQGKGGSNKGIDSKRKKRNQATASSVNKQVKKHLADIQKKTEAKSSEDPTHDEARAYIMSLLEVRNLQSRPLVESLSRVSCWPSPRTKPVDFLPVRANFSCLNTIEEER